MREVKFKLCPSVFLGQSINSALKPVEKIGGKK